MVRILSKGSQLDYADYADWDESANVRDYDIVFINLRDLERRKDEFLHARVPAEYRRLYEFPLPEHVVQLLLSGGDIFVVLPFELSARPSEDQDWEPPEPIPGDTPVRGGTPILNFLSWLPFTLEVHEEGGESVEEETIDEDWDWYFDDDFSWNFSIPPSPKRSTTYYLERSRWWRTDMARHWPRRLLPTGRRERARSVSSLIGDLST